MHSRFTVHALWVRLHAKQYLDGCLFPGSFLFVCAQPFASVEVRVMQIEKRISRVTEERRGRGDDRPPPPKTTLSGPRLFGFTTDKVPNVFHTSDSPRFSCLRFNVRSADHKEKSKPLFSRRCPSLLKDSLMKRQLPLFPFHMDLK
jgi:hypothetical protein